MNSSRPDFTRMTALLSVLGLFLVFTGSAVAAEYASIKSNGVNVRSGPSTDELIRWEVFEDFPLEVLGKKGDWVNSLDFEGDEGWVYAPLLSDKKTVIVRKDKVNLRDKPSTDDDTRVVALVKYGVVFEAVAKEGEWLKVRHADGTEGWVHRDLVWPSDPLD